MALDLARQFDVLRNQGRSRLAYPYQLILQSDRLDRGTAVVAAPMVVAGPVVESRLSPSFTVDGRRCTLLTSELAAVPRAALADCVGSLDHERHVIIAAIDFLFTGV